MQQIIVTTIVMVLALIILPLTVIWSINTLFPTLLIAYTWQTWLATIVIVGAVRGYGSRK